MVIKTKKWNKKKREETKKPLIIVVDNYLREVDVNKCYDNIYRTGWLNFCYMNKKFILKQDMSTEEKKNMLMICILGIYCQIWIKIIPKK